MFKKLLIAVDGTDLSDRALSAGLALAQLGQASVVALHAAPPMMAATAFVGEAYVGPSQAEYDTDMADARGRVEEQVTRLAKQMGVRVDLRHVVAAEIWRAIIELAEETACDTVVMGSFGRGPLSALLLGSDTQSVLSHCKIPVLVVR